MILFLSEWGKKNALLQRVFCKLKQKWQRCNCSHLVNPACYQITAVLQNAFINNEYLAVTLHTDAKK